MQKIYFTLFLSVLVAGLNAQQLIPLPNDSMEISLSADDEFTPSDAHLELINNSNTSISVTWGLVSNSSPAQWSMGLCDNNNCYDLLFSGGPFVSLPVDAFDTLDMKLQYTAHCVTGTGNAIVYAYVTGDSANSVVFLTYKVNLTAACPNSVIETVPRPLKIYPNPVRSSFVVTGVENAGNLSFEVYDMKGAAVKSEIKEAPPSRIEISLENLPEGNYMLKAFDSHGKVFGTSRLSKVE